MTPNYSISHFPSLPQSSHFDVKFTNTRTMELLTNAEFDRWHHHHVNIITYWYGEAEDQI